jgi:hypothetical protein
MFYTIEKLGHGLLAGEYAARSGTKSVNDRIVS